MNNIQKILVRELVKKSLHEFVKFFWHTADPSEFKDSILLQFFCEAFQYSARNWVPYKELKIEIPPHVYDMDIIDVRHGRQHYNVNIPPRHSKSMIFNVLGPVWLWINYPAKAAAVSHTGKLSGQMNSKRHAILNSPEFKDLFPDIILTDNTSEYLKDDRGAELYSVAKNSFTGFGADMILNDDLTNAEVAKKDQMEMANTWSYYKNTMPSRINDITTGVIWNIQQRLAPNDITGQIMNDKELAELYIFIKLPAIFKKDTAIILPITGKIHIFKAGDFLWPERFGDYSSLRKQLGSSIFETQYLQEPTASDAIVFRDDYIKVKKAYEVPDIEEADMTYISHDFPIKDKENSDFVGSVLGYRVGSTLYIKNCIEKRMDFVKAVRFVEQVNSLYPGIIQVIEDKANGSPILQQLQDVISGLAPFEPGTKSKVQRAESSTVYMELGNVIFVEDEVYELPNDGGFDYRLSSNLDNLVERLKKFPYVNNDDIVDALVQLILYVFMDMKNSVYYRSFNAENVLKISHGDELDRINKLYSTIFFNKEGDLWKILEIKVDYGVETKLIVVKEKEFKANMEEGFKLLKEFSPKSTVFIDCSATVALRGMHTGNVTIERYNVADFDQSVALMGLAFSNKRILIMNECSLVKSDIEMFKFAKSKDENVKYVTTKDGFVACLRTALKYYGGIV